LGTQRIKLSKLPATLRDVVLQVGRGDCQPYTVCGVDSFWVLKINHEEHERYANVDVANPK
jgi:hypothetical protein